MTVSKTTTQEKAREFNRNVPMTYPTTPAEYLAEFADSLTAELQKENAALKQRIDELEEGK